ncbi:protein phosphatase 1 regulatory subunit 37-like [Arapaima gigas]
MFAKLRLTFIHDQKSKTVLDEIGSSSPDIVLLSRTGSLDGPINSTTLSAGHRRCIGGSARTPHTWGIAAISVPVAAPRPPGRHGGEIIGFVVTSSSCQELASAAVSDEDITVTGPRERISWHPGTTNKDRVGVQAGRVWPAVRRTSEFAARPPAELSREEGRKEGRKEGSGSSASVSDSLLLSAGRFYHVAWAEKQKTWFEK